MLHKEGFSLIKNILIYLLIFNGILYFLSINEYVLYFFYIVSIGFFALVLYFFSRSDDAG